MSLYLGPQKILDRDPKTPERCSSRVPRSRIETSYRPLTQRPQGTTLSAGESQHRCLYHFWFSQNINKPNAILEQQ